VRGQLHRAWKAVSDVDTALSWLSRFALLKLVVGLLTGTAAAVGGAVEGYAWPVIFIMALFSALAGIWLVNGVLFLRHQRATRKLQIGEPKQSATGLIVRPPATADELRQNYIRDRSVWLTDFVRESDRPPIIRNKTFENCNVNGPAIVYAVGPTVYYGGSIAIRSLDDAYITVDPDPARQLIGIVGLDGCTFRDCRFAQIGFIGTPDDRERAREQITGTSS
jgi:hypothetical protein